MKILKLIGLMVGLLVFGSTGYAQSPINYAEYYWDTDPGLGLATSLGSVNTTNLDLTTNVSTTGLSVGNHVLNVRVRDANNIWSKLLTKVVLVAPETYNPGTHPQDIRVLEYVWDSQTPVQVTVSGIVNFEFIQTIPTTSLGEGSHILSIRMKDAYGVWSSTNKYTVFVYGNAPGDNIAKIEYFIGDMTTDPGYDLATSVSFTPASSPDVTAEFEPSTTGLPNGENLITFRIKDAQNKWSGLYQKVFNNDPSFSLIAGNTLNAGSIAANEFCLGGTIKVPITKTGVFPTGNQFVLELSNSSGTNFVPIPTTINLAQDILTGTLPANLSHATGYRIRAVTTLPLIRKTSATILTIGNSVTANTTNPILCTNDNLLLNSATFVASNYSWAGPASFTSTDQNAIRNNIPVNGGGIYTVTATSIAAGCVATATASVTVKPLPTVTPTSPITVCTDFPLTLGVNTTAGGTYAWNGPNTFTSALQNPTVSNLATATMAGTYTITVILNGCSASNTSTVTVKLPLFAPTAPGQTICYNTTASLSATCINGSPVWYNASSVAIPFSGSPFVTPNLITNTTYKVRCESGGIPNCLGAFTDVIVTVFPNITAPTGTANQTICYNTTTSLSATCQSNTTPKWYNSSTVLQFTGSPFVTPNLTANTTYKVRCESGGVPNCIGAFATDVVVTVFSNVVAPTGTANQMVCYNTNASLSATCQSGTTANWYNSSTVLQFTGMPFVTPNLTTNTTYKVRCESGGIPNCTGVFATDVVVTVNPLVNAPTATGVTINQNTSTSLSATCTGSTAKWYTANTGGTLLGTGTYTTPSLAVNTIYYVACETGTSPNCVSTRTAQTITICPTTLSPTNTVTTNQKAVTTVISTSINTIPNAANVIYQAGNYVQLNAGFVANSGSVFTAKILANCQ